MSCWPVEGLSRLWMPVKLMTDRDVTPIEIYDTSLRDGNQGEGVNLSLADKLEIAGVLDRLGVPFTEGGWPGSIPKIVNFSQRREMRGIALSKFRRLAQPIARTASLRMITF